MVGRKLERVPDGRRRPVGKDEDAAEDRPVRLYLAGTISLRAPTGRVIGERALAGRQGRRVLVRLAAIHEPASQQELAADLWGDAWPAAWEVGLRAIVSKLRAALSKAGIANAIAATDGSYEFRVARGVWVDLDGARDAIHRAESALSRDDLADAAGWGLAARAIAARRILPGEEGEWLDGLRGRQEDVLLRSLECLGEVWLRHGDPALAARDAMEAIGLDPYCESAHRLLIRAHLAAGERASALRAYAACRTLLEDDLQVAPAAETRALVVPWLEESALGS